MSAMLRVDGAVTFWSLGSSSSLDLLRQGFAAVGPVFEKLAPKERTKTSVLHDALSVVFPKALLRPLEKRDGFAVLQEVRFRDDVQTTCTHAVAVDEQTGAIDFRRGYDFALYQRVAHEYQAQSLLVKPQQVAISLVACINELAGVSLRPSGGFYWMPDSALPLWNQIVDVVQRAGKNSVYQITHSFDSDSIRAVRDAILAEAEKEAADILTDVESGKLGERALKTRAADAENLQRKVEEYERLLGEALPVAAAIAKKAEITALSAHVTAMGAVAV
jgi:hypothetical protein